jgi:hypothetical protein
MKYLCHINSNAKIMNYCSDTSDKQKRDMSKSISEYTTVRHNTNVLTSVAGIDDQFDDTISENEQMMLLGTLGYQ